MSDNTSYDALRDELRRRLTDPQAVRRPDRVHTTNAAEIVWTAQHGPRNTAVAQAILGNSSLSAMLEDEWQEHPPTAELRERLQQDPYGVSLLSLAPREEVALRATNRSSLWERLGRHIADRLSFAPIVPIQAASARGSSGLRGDDQVSRDVEAGVPGNEPRPLRSIARVGAVRVTLATDESDGQEYVLTLFGTVHAGEVMAVEWSNGVVQVCSLEAGLHSGLRVVVDRPQAGAVPLNLFVGPVPD